MSLRWRETGELLCAAKYEARDSDCYVDDSLHYQLSVILGVIRPDENEAENGIWCWKEPGELGFGIPHYKENSTK